jgi:ethanolamine utilization protein EutM
MVETKGLAALIEASDAMIKAANVEMLGWDKVGSGMVTSFVSGDVAAVKAAIDAGADAAGRVGEVISAHVIARPHEDLPNLLPKPKKAAAGK